MGDFFYITDALLQNAALKNHDTHSHTIPDCGYSMLFTTKASKECVLPRYDVVVIESILPDPPFDELFVAKLVIGNHVVNEEISLLNVAIPMVNIPFNSVSITVNKPAKINFKVFTFPDSTHQLLATARFVNSQNRCLWVCDNSFTREHSVIQMTPFLRHELESQ